jgi:hypothetical protein
MPPLVSVGWRGPEVERLLDEAHSALVESVVAVLASGGWQTMPEFSFNHFGERGSVDVLAWHEGRRALLIVEVKTRLWDLQAMLSALDRKRRILPGLVRAAFGHAGRVGVVLVLPEGSSSRAVVARREATFDAALPDRKIAVRNWLDRPDRDLRGIWFFHDSRAVTTRGEPPTSRSAARRRVARTGLLVSRRRLKRAE